MDGWVADSRCIRRRRRMFQVGHACCQLSSARLWPAPREHGVTQTPIKHVIVIIGENRSFDHVFATYVPKNGETVDNLLSEGIVTLDANKNAIPGPNFAEGASARRHGSRSTDPFLLSPPKQTFPNNQLPAPLVGGPKGNYIHSGADLPAPSPTPASLTLAEQSESGLPADYYP